MASTVAVATFASCFLLCALFAPCTKAGIDCDGMKDNLKTCIQYFVGKSMKPPTSCCSGMTELNKAVKSKEDRIAACECIRESADKTPAFRPDRVNGINRMCSVKLPFDVFINSGCSEVK
ncbi:hypothetical protein H6P81_011942 [Aristolochia fimbriata]|uniref:Bifunctional inhibitor/plant lipid transfer protein/seed storage helical domain-containing protein n=1 Tax=Aristolochia fimbriata TaxID=158543 RepID=A0AAV7EAZ5_ARIFI|nr:hypothetical protein H6P81_011942 [Aristolochia fimbriata]